MTIRRDERMGGGGVAELAVAQEPRRSRLPLVVGAVLALVAGLAIGRFVTADGGGGTGAGVAAVAPGGGRTLAERVAALEARVAADPDDVSGWQSLGDAYVRRAAEGGDPALYDLAGRAYDEADARVPDDPATLIGRGALALALHRFADALALGERAVAARPASAAALGVVVDAQVELGRYDEAAATLQRMLDRRPDLAALSRTSYLRELHGDLPGAIDAMVKAESAGAGSGTEVATVAALLGDLHLAAGDLDQAGAAFDRARAAAPELVAAEVGRARVLAADGGAEEAEALLERSVERVPVPAAAQLLGELRAGLGDEDGAADAFELVRAAARLQEASGQVVDLEMALFEADRGDPARAVDLARRAHEARPDNVYANDALGWALLRAGDPAAARPHVEAALRLGTVDADVRWHAAATFAALGERARAAEELERALGPAGAGAARWAEEGAALAADLGVAVPGT